MRAESGHESPYKHAVASLEYLNEVTKKYLDIYSIPWVDEIAARRKREMMALADAADIVLIHWWNHPLMMQLIFQGLPPARIIMWSHVNGFFPPQSFFPSLFDMTDMFVFTSATSLNVPSIQFLTDQARAKLRVIRSCSGIPEGAEHVCEKSNPFQAGYVGTVEPAKMHPDFLRMCADADIATPVVVAGGPAYEELRKKAADMNLAAMFNILGPVPDPKTIYRQLHAFAYPLSPRHYGTGEQVLIEAMAYGAVPVVLSNPPEVALIKHGETGLVAKSATEFSAALRMLLQNPAERNRLALGGHRFVIEECGIEHSIRAFHALFDEMLSLPKKRRKLQVPSIEGVRHGSPLHLFLTSMGHTEERRIIENAIIGNSDISMLPADFRSKTRGTPYHYSSMLEPDQELMVLCNKVGMNRK
jgi:glycosyltransferase involved in cell wall biosynthesis